jgi:hypothetical protein
MSEKRTKEETERLLVEGFKALVPPGTTRQDFDDAIAADRAMRHARRHTLSSPGAEVEALLADMTPEERLRVFEPYCKHCGDPQAPGFLCQCWNDE